MIQADAWRITSAMKHVNDPGNAHQPILYLHLDDIAAAEVVEVYAVHRDALDAMSFAPGGHYHAPAWQRSAPREFPPHTLLFDLRRGAVERPICQHQSCENPRQRDQS